MSVSHCILLLCCVFSHSDVIVHIVYPAIISDVIVHIVYLVRPMY